MLDDLQLDDLSVCTCTHGETNLGTEVFSRLERLKGMFFSIFLDLGPDAVCLAVEVHFLNLF